MEKKEVATQHWAQVVVRRFGEGLWAWPDNMPCSVLPLYSLVRQRVWGAAQGAGNSGTRACWSWAAPEAHGWRRWGCRGARDERPSRPCWAAFLPPSAKAGFSGCNSTQSLMLLQKALHTLSYCAFHFYSWVLHCQPVYVCLHVLTFAIVPAGLPPLVKGWRFSSHSCNSWAVPQNTVTRSITLPVN